MSRFHKEFRTLHYVVRRAERVLLFAHTRPDGDTIGATIAFKEYLVNQGKRADIACFDPLPVHMAGFFHETFLSAGDLDLREYDVFIACDSVDRGFRDVRDRLEDWQVVALLDHHPDIELTADIVIIDPRKSSTCEIIFDYFEHVGAEITPGMATALLVGLIFDTGNFQHSSTTPRVMDIASALMRRGASLARAVEVVFTNQNISVLRLWGRAFMKARIRQENGMIVSALTGQDLEECEATSEDVYQVVSVLNSVPGARFALVLLQRDDGMIKAHLRSEEYKGVDVRRIARRFGGGGHKFASGFEIPGRIVETASGWEIM